MTTPNEVPLPKGPCQQCADRHFDAARRIADMEKVHAEKMAAMERENRQLKDEVERLGCRKYMPPSDVREAVQMTKMFERKRTKAVIEAARHIDAWCALHPEVLLPAELLAEIGDMQTRLAALDNTKENDG